MYIIIHTYEQERGYIYITSESVKPDDTQRNTHNMLILINERQSSGSIGKIM